MEDKKMASIDGGRSGPPRHPTVKDYEDMKKLLTCAHLELESTRQAAKAQNQMHDSRVRHLEELLKTLRRERDEAIEQCMQLEGRLAVFSTSLSLTSGLTQEAQLRALPGLQSMESVASMASMAEPSRATLTEVRRKLQGQSQEPLRSLPGLQPMESVGSMVEPSRATLAEVHRNLQGQSQEPLIRSLSGLQPLESVASMPEPSRATLTEVHRKFQGQQPQFEVQKQLEYVSSMTEPTRDTLTEVHRKMQEQFELQQMERQQKQHHHMDLQHQHSNHSQLERRPSPTSSNLEFQSQQQHQLEELRQHLEIQHKDQVPEQLHLDMVIDEREGDEASHNEADNGSDAKSTTWNEFSSGVHMEIHSSNEQRLILDNPERMHMKLTQGLPSPRIDQHSPPHLEDLKQQLQLQQRQQEDNMHLHLHHQQESEQRLSHMQQGPTSESCSLHLQDEQPHQLTQHQDGLSPISVSLQGTNDGVMSMPVMQHSSWPVSLMALSSGSLSNGVPNGLSEQLLQNSCLQGGSVVASLLTPLERFVDGGSSSLLHSRPVHLPEPPEADPQVMLNSLPEKGKLLQAVMQAGPLLQALLVSGPLPQWRYPPPTLDSEEIPRVSMGVAGGGSMPTVEQTIGPMTGHGSTLEQVMRLTTPVHSSPTQNGFCH